MKKSPFFEELSSAYFAELDDLSTDSEGKSVLSSRLKEKRKQLDTLVQMIEFSPEMVLPIFYGAFSFTDLRAVGQALQCEPDDDDFPAWDELSQSLSIADWATPLADRVLAAGGGEQFMVIAAAAELLRNHDTAAPAPAAVEKNDFDEEGDEDGEFGDLSEAGADWLSEQGFDSHNG